MSRPARLARPARTGPDGREGVVDRKMIFCERLQQWDQQRLIQTCRCCNNFFVHCCACDMGEWDKVADLGFDKAQAEAVWQAAIANREATNTTCHHYRLLCVKGLTINSGKERAVAGLGFAFGTSDEVQGSLAVDEEIDPSTIPVTMQRAEILGAIEGLLALSCWDSQHEKKARRSKGRGSKVEDKNWVIATDSGSLVKGMTELLPQWKRNEGKDTHSVKPANFDLLQTLHTAIVAEEAKQRVKIGFWKIPKDLNVAATLLARKALVAAADSRYTEAELAELGKKRRAEPKKVVESVASKKNSESEIPPLDEILAKPQTGKDAISTKAKTKAKTKATETGPVSFKTHVQGTPVLIDVEGPRGTHVEASAPDLGTVLLHSYLRSIFDVNDELDIYPWVSPKPTWWFNIGCVALEYLFLHQCVEHADKWAGAYGAYLVFLMNLT